MNKFEKIYELLKEWFGEQWEDGEIDRLIYDIMEICEEDNHIEKQIQKEIENNGYYENIRVEYSMSEDKQHYIETIYNIYWDWYNAEFSIYKVMDTIENYMRENGDSFDTVVDYEEFSL